MTGDAGTARKRRRLEESSSIPGYSPTIAYERVLATPPASLATRSTSSVVASTPPASTVRPEPKDDAFFGSTAFNAVFADNEAHIPSENAVESEAASGIRLHNQIMANWKSTCTENSYQADNDLVLDLLSKEAHLSKIIDVLPSESDCTCMIVQWRADIQRSIKSHILDAFDLTDANSRKSLIEVLDSNIRKALVLPTDVRFKDFISHYSLRWELLGVYFTVCGFSLMYLTCTDERLDFVGRTEHDKQQLLFRLLEASDYIVSMCNGPGIPGTDLGFWLTCDNCIYASQVLGDAHYNVWKSLGLISTKTFAEGIHQDSKTAPFWLKEFRRRGLAYAYAGDKILSTFVGRPPRISKRYCHIQIPLDLDNVEMALEGDKLAQALGNLNEAGWNIGSGSSGRPSSERLSTFGPMFVACALIREEILELCLGPPQNDIRERANELIRRGKALFASFPARVQYSPKMPPMLHAPVPTTTVHSYLDHTYNEFMIRRYLVRQLHDDPTELLQLADKILEAVLAQKNSRDVAISGVGFSWSVVLYGLPAAGVLALELLQLNVQAVPHAKIKQNLCVFISYLKCIHVPGEGNYALTMRAWEILQAIMDKVLTPEKPPQTQGQQKSTDAGVAPEFSQVELMDDFGVLDFSWNDPSHFDQFLWDGLNAMA